MPNLEKLIDGGVMGRLATLDPPLSPTLWTSIATGKRPYKHGIHGFTEPDPSGDGIRPIYSTNRQTKALWNILTQRGLRTHVVGWWPSHPAEPINGTMISNLYQRAPGNLGDPWPVLRGTVHPAEQTDLFARLRIHPQELTGNHLEPFVPRLAEIDQRTDRRLYSIAKNLADCSTIHAAATYVMDHEEWDFMAVYYDAIDHFCHGFMKYHPPRRPHIPVRDYELYKGVVEAGCRYHDMMLGAMLDEIDDDTTVMLISDHGFHPDHNRPVRIPNEPAGPAVEHSPYGIFVLKGPGIKQDDTVFGASLLDVAPTVLTLFGLPVGEDMDGKVLTSVFEQSPEVQHLKSWENIPGADGSHPPEAELISADDARAELRQLIELGYIADPGENGAAAVKSTLDENNYNLARAHIDGQQWAEGIEILERLHTENPETARFAVRLAVAYQATGKLRDARRVVDHLRKLMDRESPQLDLMEGNLLMGEERYRRALELFERVERDAGDQAGLHLRLARAYQQLNRPDDAERALQRALDLDPEDHAAHHTLGLLRYQRTDYEGALDALMDSVGLLYHNPTAHYYIGETLRAMGKYEDAVTAYETTLRMVPAMNMARRQLITVLEDNLQQPGRALRYRTDFHEKIRGTIDIVSGLPRSGTSMMMQMLDVSGREIFTDGARSSDESNPRGYYEHEQVKSLARNKKWLPEAEGKTVKVIAHLLKHLPQIYRYRVVFMERDVYEVVASQQKMLVRQGRQIVEDTLPLNLVRQYEKTLAEVKQWAADQPNVEILYVSHADVIRAPLLQAMLVNDFFDGELQPDLMANVVDGQLYRSRKGAISS